MLSEEKSEKRKGDDEQKESSQIEETNKRKRKSSSSSNTSTDSFAEERKKNVFKKKIRKYKHAVLRWEEREEKRANHYQKIQRKIEKRGSEREANKLRKFLANYEDIKDDPTWYTGEELKERSRLYEKELEFAAQDRIDEQREIEEERVKAEELTKAALLKAKVKDESKQNKIETVEVEPEPERWVSREESGTEAQNMMIPKPMKPFATLTNKQHNVSLSERLKKVFGKDNDDMDLLHTRKRLKPFEITHEERIAHMTDIEKKKILKELLEKIPKEKDDLFAMSLDRSQIDTNWVNTRLRPWVLKRVEEFIGEEEVTFCDYICERINSETDPHKMLDDVKIILDEDAEVFMIKLWRLIAFETEAKKQGLPLAV